MAPMRRGPAALAMAGLAVMMEGEARLPWSTNRVTTCRGMGRAAGRCWADLAGMVHHLQGALPPQQRGRGGMAGVLLVRIHEGPPPKPQARPPQQRLTSVMGTTTPAATVARLLEAALVMVTTPAAVSLTVRVV